jgi:hypothetical protein
LPADPNMTYPVCTGGQRAGPPEDCGGIPGFYELMEAIEDPRHAQPETLEMAGEDFDPQAFSLEEVNGALQRRSRRAGS